MNCLAVIPARCGSKRIKNKNIKDFFGVPIIKYSIDAAMESRCFDEVMVSTDSGIIAEIALKYGAEVPFMRSEETSDDHAVLADVLSEIIDEYEKKSRKFDYICMILPTAPFLNGNILRKGYEKIKEYDSVISAAKFSYPVQRALRITDGYLTMINPDNINVRSQDLEETYHDSGQFYWIKTDSFKAQKKIFMKKTTFVEVPSKFIQDIDTEEDWEIAEIKYRIIKEMTYEKNKKRFETLDHK